VAEAISAFVPDFTGLKPGASIAESVLLLQTFNEPSGEKRKVRASGLSTLINIYIELFNF
jgi:hypothetical protein